MPPRIYPCTIIKKEENRPAFLIFLVYYLVISFILFIFADK